MMKKPCLISILLLIVLNLHAQEEKYSIPLNIKYASDYELISSVEGNTCLYFSQRDSYYILLLDANFMILKEYKGMFRTTNIPEFVGSHSSKNKFDLFFKQVEQDKLLVLSIDMNTLTLSRTKDFKISDETTKKVLFTESTVSGRGMETILLNRNALRIKKHLPDLKFEITDIQLKPEDVDFMLKKDFLKIVFDVDSILLFQYVMEDQKNKKGYRFFTFDILKEAYTKTEYYFDKNKFWNSDPYSVIFRDVAMIVREDDHLQFLSHQTGELLNEIRFNIDSILSEDQPEIFQYSYFCQATNKAANYSNPKGEDRKELGKLPVVYDLFSYDSTIYLELLFRKPATGFSCAVYSRLVLPFNWENKCLDQNLFVSNNFVYKNSKFMIDKLRKYKPKLYKFNYGFNDILLFSCYRKKEKEFILFEFAE